MNILFLNGIVIYYRFPLVFCINSDDLDYLHLKLPDSYLITKYGVNSEFARSRMSEVTFSLPPPDVRQPRRYLA